MAIASFEDTSLFFEGSEKKVEVIVDNNQLSLLNDFDDQFWSSLVACCNAQILSSVKNENCKAYLLSESSLFVWDDRFLILTCGITQLVNSLEFFLKSVNSSEIKHVIYQRKNEYFAHAQLSSFGDDIKLLSKYIPGKAYRFGELDGHHNYIFHLDNAFTADNNDKTYELLAYQISKEASEKLSTPGLSANDIRSYLQLEQLLPGFDIDDFVFDPYGYSVNAIKDGLYLTIHVTPQENSSYVSIESNLNLIESAQTFLSILSPTSFDLLGFNEFEFEQLAKNLIPSQYMSTSLVKETLSNGYFVCFANYVLPQTHFKGATELDIAGENHAL